MTTSKTPPARPERSTPVDVRLRCRKCREPSPPGTWFCPRCGAEMPHAMETEPPKGTP